MMKRRGFLLSLMATAPVLTGAREGKATEAAKDTAPATYTNPVIDRDLPDPGIIAADGVYWMTHTTGGPDVGCPLYRSTDLVHWTFVTHLLTKENKSPWMRDTFWAPEIHRITIKGKARYLLTFTARHAETDRLCIALAAAEGLQGPYRMPSAPIVSDSVATIDSHIFPDADGKLYLLWKRDSETAQGVGGTIRIQQLDDTGTGFAPGTAPITLLSGDPKTTDPAAIWERGLVEAPWMMKRNGFYYLFYSGAFIDTSYAVGVARASAPTGPFLRCAGNPILRSNAAWGGPGHGAFVTDRAGVDWHLYHARHQDRRDFGRVQLLDRLYWNGDWPAFGNGGTPSFGPEPTPKTR